MACNNKNELRNMLSQGIVGSAENLLVLPNGPNER